MEKIKKKLNSKSVAGYFFFFFKQKTAYEFGQ